MAVVQRDLALSSCFAFATDFLYELGQGIYFLRASVLHQLDRNKSSSILTGCYPDVLKHIEAHVRAVMEATFVSNS